jgi:hypothetical protein
VLGARSSPSIVCCDPQKLHPGETLANVTGSEIFWLDVAADLIWNDPVKLACCFRAGGDHVLFVLALCGQPHVPGV